MKIPFLSLIFSIPVFLFSQSLSFREDFNDNKLKWWTGSNEFYEGKIENGHYQLNYKTKESPEKNILMIYDKINLYKPWDIETRVKVVELKGEQNSFGISIGEKDRGNSHYYILSPALKMTWWYQYKLYKQEVIRSEPLPLKIFDKDDAATGTKIYLKYRDGNIYFYVNDEYMNKMAAPALWLGTGIGLFANTGSTLQVDYIEIKQF